MAVLEKTNVEVSAAEVFNSLIDKVKQILETPRAELEFTGDDITGADLFYFNSIPAYFFYNNPVNHINTYNCNITTIGAYAFASTKLSKFDIPETVTDIANYSFYKCSISSINFPNNSAEITIGSSAFYQTNLTSIDIPSSVKSIGDSAFYYCQKLKSIRLPDTKVELGTRVFGWTGITSFVFPEWLTDVPSEMFYCCKSLNITSLPNTIVSIGSGAFQATASTFTEIPNSVTSIDSRAFIGILSTSITIPSSVKELGSSLFSGSAKVSTLRIYCNLSSGMITDSINKNSTLKYVEIGGNIKLTPFKGCTGLLKAWIRNTCASIEYSQTISSMPFYGITNIEIYVEADSKPAEWPENFNQTGTSTFATVIYGVKNSPF